MSEEELFSQLFFFCSGGIQGGVLILWTDF